MRYTICNDGRIDCPICGTGFKAYTDEDQVGSEAECKACGAVLEVMDIDLTRTIWWSPRDDVRWREFCRLWYQIGRRVRLDCERDLRAAEAP